LEVSANPNHADSSGWTALLRAAQHGHADVIDALLAAEADVNAQDRLGWNDTPPRKWTPSSGDCG